MKPQRTQSQLRRTNRGNVPGFLGMAEMAMLSGRQDTTSKPTKCARCDGSARAVCTRQDCPQVPPALGQCDTCQRKTWEPAVLGHWCGMTQVDGSKCQGTFR